MRRFTAPIERLICTAQFAMDDTVENFAAVFPHSPTSMPRRGLSISRSARSAVQYPLQVELFLQIMLNRMASLVSLVRKIGILSRRKPKLHQLVATGLDGFSPFCLLFR